MANLTQLKALEDLAGFLLVDKPEGINFATVMKTVKRKFGLVKVGHGGSLDVQASGLMIILVGDATKFDKDVMGADREYEIEVEDAGGLKSTPAILDEFRGDIFQTEPRFAVIKREDTGVYEEVDTGEHQPFMTHIYRIDEIDDGHVEGERGSISLQVKCTARTNMRALASDMGGSLKKCRRTKIGKFGVEDAIPFAKLLELEMKDFSSCVMPLKKALQ